jgi:hypothetical protein
VTTTFLYQGAVHHVDAARSSATGLWLTPASLRATTGWDLKPEGLCRAEECVPAPADAAWIEGSAEGRVDLCAVAAHLGQPAVRDGGHNIWAFGDRVATWQHQAEGAQAPEFALPDLHGREVRLSDFRGTKVFLHTWATYCGCAFDPPVWQVIAEELRPAGLQVVGVALDTAGAAAVASRLDPDGYQIENETLRVRRGWSSEVWRRQAVPTYPCLVDATHALAVTYGMTNIPTAAWIDEAGDFVRLPEPAGVGDEWREQDVASGDLPEDAARRAITRRQRYVDALRDWVANSADSVHARSPDEVRAQRVAPREPDVRATTHLALAQFLFTRGDHGAAARHVARAAQLCPQRWNYRRQSMVLEPETVGELNRSPEFWDAMEALGEDRYYEPIDMPGM